MLVSLWMARELITVSPETSVSQAAALLAERGIRRVLVTRGQIPRLRLLGIATARDIARAFSPGGDAAAARRPVSEVMTAGVHTVPPGTPIEEAARILREQKIGALPVVEGENLLGIITESDIFRAFIEVVGVREKGVRVLFQDPSEDDLVGTVASIGRKHGLRVASVLSLDHDRKRLAAVRLHGHDQGVDRFIEEIWKSGRRVLDIHRSEGRPR